MTRKQQIDWLCRLKSEIKIFMPYQWQNPFQEALDMAIKALEQEPTTKNDLVVDCISRADARSLICDIDLKHQMFGMSRKAFKELYNGIDELPSVTPIRPKGHWIVEKGGSYLGKRNACCSNCKDFYSNDWNVFNYCPNCGAKMDEVKE